MSAAAELTTLADVLRWAATRLARADVYFGHGTDNAWDEAAALLCGRLSVPPDKLEFVLSARLLADERRDLVRLLERRIAHRIPLPYLVGEAWFAGRRYLIEPGVLIPRSPIAELIEASFAPWLARPPRRILDLCTGCGCIGIACAHAYPDAEVMLADDDDTALALARKNVVLHGVGDRVGAVKADLFTGLPPGRFDLIVTNPPYVDAADLAALPREFRHEPQHALAAGQDGLAVVDRILANAGGWLSKDGLLIGEVGATATALLEAHPQLPFIWPDLERGGRGVFVLDAASLA